MSQSYTVNDCGLIVPLLKTKRLNLNFKFGQLIIMTKHCYSLHRVCNEAKCVVELLLVRTCLLYRPLMGVQFHTLLLNFEFQIQNVKNQPSNDT